MASQIMEPFIFETTSFSGSQKLVGTSSRLQPFFQRLKFRFNLIKPRPQRQFRTKAKFP